MKNSVYKYKNSGSDLIDVAVQKLDNYLNIMVVNHNIN